MNLPRLRILSLIGSESELQLPADLRDQVEFIDVSPSEPVPPGLGGDVLLMSFRCPAIYELAERGVKWVHFIGTGIDSFDVERLTRGRVMTIAHGAAVPAAEWVLAALLHHEKRLSEVFVRSPGLRLPAHEMLGTLHGRQLALLGFGAIGIEVAVRALSFGARVRALRRTAAPSPMAGVDLVRTVRDLVTDADHLILTAPLTADTHLILNAEVLKWIKPGLHLVNVSRGGLIDQDALHDALDQGRVSAATLDSVSPEPLPTGHWMYQHPRIWITPHIAWSWPHVRQTAVDIFASNLRLYLAGQPLPHVIDPQRGY